MKRPFSSPRLFSAFAFVALVPLALAGCGGGGSNNPGTSGTTNTQALSGNLAIQAAIVSGYQTFQGGVNYPLLQVQNTLPSGSPLKSALRAAALQTHTAPHAAVPHDGLEEDALGLFSGTSISGNSETLTLYTDSSQTQSDGSLTITQTAPAVSTFNPGTYTSYPVAFTISADITGGPLPFSGSGTIHLLDANGAGEISGSFNFPASGVSATADLTLDDNGNVSSAATPAVSITENGQTISLTNLSGPFTGTITGNVTVQPQGDTGTATLSILNDSFNITLNTPTGTATGSVDSSGNLVITFPNGTTETINDPLTASPTTTAGTSTLSGTLVAGSGSQGIASISGDTVEFDGNSSLVSSPSSSTGLFSLAVPLTDITGSDTLTVFNSAGVLIAKQTITSFAPVTITLPSVPNLPNPQ